MSLNISIFGASLLFLLSCFFIFESVAVGGNGNGNKPSDDHHQQDHQKNSKAVPQNPNVDSVILAKEYHKLVVAPLKDICDKKEHFDEKTTMKSRDFDDNTKVDTVSLCATLKELDQLFIQLVKGGEGKMEEVKNGWSAKKHDVDAKNNTGHDGGTPVEVLQRIVKIIFEHSLKLTSHYGRSLSGNATGDRSMLTGFASGIHEDIQKLGENKAKLEKAFMIAFENLKRIVLNHETLNWNYVRWNANYKLLKIGQKIHQHLLPTKDGGEEKGPNISIPNDVSNRNEGKLVLLAFRQLAANSVIHVCNDENVKEREDVVKISESWLSDMTTGTAAESSSSSNGGDGMA